MTGQADLLDWQPPAPVTRFEDSRVRAATINGRIARAVSAALDDCKLGRPEIATRMSDYLGQKVTKNMLDAYASQAREDHRITVERLMALLHVTGDRRLLNNIAEMFDWVVVENRFLDLIALARLREREASLRSEIDQTRRRARAGRVL